MNRKLMALAVEGVFRDVAYQFRMPGGIPGDINRTHPFEVEARVQNALTPPTAYGQFVIFDTSSGVRPYAAADASDATESRAVGMTARPYPTSQATGSILGTQAFGVSAPSAGPIGIMRMGKMTAILNDVTATPKAGDRVYVWCAATSTIHIQGGIEVALSAGNTVELTNNVTFNGPQDGNGNVEINFGF